MVEAAAAELPAEFEEKVRDISPMDAAQLGYSVAIMLWQRACAPLPSEAGHPSATAGDEVTVPISGTVDRHDRCVQCGAAMLYRTVPPHRTEDVVGTFCQNRECGAWLVEIPVPPAVEERAEPADEVYRVGPDLRALGRVLATGKPVDDPTETEPAGGREHGCGCSFHADHKWCGSNICECTPPPFNHPCHDPACGRRP